MGDMIPTSVAARLLGLTSRSITLMCNLGVFVTATRPGYGSKPNWKLSRSEVICRKYGGKFTQEPTQTNPKPTRKYA